MLIVFLRTLILYAVIVIIMRLLGKKQIGELQPSELVLALVIADLAATPMEDVDVPLMNGIIPILTLFIAEELLSYISLKSERARGIISGKPSIVVEKGKIIEEEMKRLRYNINDLLEQIRLNGHKSIDEVEFAILETSGQLSTFPFPSKKPVTIEDLKLNAESEGLPVTLIIDGRALGHNLKIAGVDAEWLERELRKHNIRNQKDVFFAFVTKDKELRFQLKDKTN
ncbi:MAG: DUF421 domain-containing protein [Bacillota bacterium]